MRSVFILLLGALFVFTVSGQSDFNFEPRPSSLLSNPAPDKAGSERGAVQLDPVKDAAKIEDLAVLGKVWGFLKYHHPVVATQNSNWDLELFRLLPDILAAQTKLERNEILNRWVVGLGTFDATGNAPPAGPVKLEPDTSWIDSRTLGVKLAKQLNLVKNARRAGNNRYIRMAANVGNPVFQNEDPYPALTYPDTGYRMLALFRYWSIIQYFSPNRHLMGENWNAVMTQYVPRFYNAANEFEYKMSVWSLIGRIHDTHANIWNTDPAIVPYRGVNAASVKVRFIEEKLVVTGYWNQTGQQTGLQVGDVIETIDGQTVQDYVNEHLEYTPASNYPTQLRDIALYILRTNNNSLSVTYRRDGVPGAVTMRTYPRANVFNASTYWDPNKPPFELIGTDIAYIFSGTLQEGQTKSLIPQIQPTRGLIIDMRSYPSDNTFLFYMTTLLVPGPANFATVSQGSISTPGLFTLRNSFPVGGAGTYYNGKVVIMVNEITQSSAEFHTMAFRITPGAVVIGSTTAGADGNVSEFFLPGGLRTWISGIGIYYPDGRETQRIGIVPDIVVKPTIAGVKAGRDEVLEKAIEIINSN